MMAMPDFLSSALMAGVSFISLDTSKIREAAQGVKPYDPGDPARPDAANRSSTETISETPSST